MMMPTQINTTTRNKVLVISAGLILIGLAFYFVTSGKKEEGGVPDVVDFNFHVRPILSDRCFKCHGPDANKRQANLRLDTEEGAYAALKEDPSKHVIVPGDPMQSALYARLINPDTAEVMPPPSSNLSLTKMKLRSLKNGLPREPNIKNTGLSSHLQGLRFLRQMKTSTQETPSTISFLPL